MTEGKDDEQPNDDAGTPGGAKKAGSKKSASRKASASRKSAGSKSAGGEDADGKTALSKTSGTTRAVGRKKVIEVGITPFTLWNVRLSFTPPVPYLSDFHELNVRTYVLYRGVPGVWFFSLNTNSSMTVFGARTFYFLPYFNANIDLRREGDIIHYHLRRTEAERPARFDASWEIGKELPEAEPGTLEFFLTERYCLYSASGESIYRARINHRPWPLRQAALLSYDSDIAESDYLPKLKGKPLVHYAESLAVDVWPPEKA
jgi:uncharacterized protein YqjF (DUF2071 family)